MARQIRVIKCPQCGGTTPIEIGEDHYRCDKCGTQFILDSDDINVNVNHRYEQPVNNNSASFLKIFFIIIAIAAVVVFITVISFFVKQVIRSTRTTTRTEQPQIPVRSNDFYAIPLPVNTQNVVFFVTKERGGNYAKFQDIDTKTILKEQKLPDDINIEKLEHRFFLSDSTYYTVVDEKFIYKMNLRNFTFSDITAEICTRKPALNAGLASVSFVAEGSGEGFCLNTNLGKRLYYFPKADVLYSEKAFEHVINNISTSFLDGAKSVVYYLFLNKESDFSSNVAQLYEITYKFNNGGPENKLMKMNKVSINSPGEYAIESYKPITKDCVYFSPRVLYSDKQYILVSYQPSLAEDAGTNIDLIDVNGQIVWSKSFKEYFNVALAVRTNKGFMLQTGEKVFLTISTNGQQVQSYKI